MATGGVKIRNVITTLWRIEYLTLFQRRLHGTQIVSPYFDCDLGTFYLALYPRGCDENEDDKYLHLQLYTRFSSLGLNCKFSLLSNNGLPLVTRKGTHKKDTLWEFFDGPNCVLHEEVFKTKKSVFLPWDTLTVRCRIWKSKGNLARFELLSGWCRIEAPESSFLWPISEFSGLNLLQTNFFLLDLDFRSWTATFRFWCSLVGDSLRNSQLDIQVTAGAIDRECLVLLKVSILGNGTEVIRLSEREHSFPYSRTDQTWNPPKYALKEELPQVMSVFSCDKSLHLRFHLTAFGKSFTGSIDPTFFGTWDLGPVPADLTFAETSSQTAQQSGISSVDVLLDDFLSLYRERKFSDFELRSGDASFPVHKVVLCARSPVFSSMFSCSMKESSSNFLEVPDLDADTLNRFLTFLYKGTVELELSLEGAATLYYAADKYQVDSLKSLCSSVMQFYISVSNVSDILTLADRHQDAYLKSFVLDFIRKHFEDVMLSDEWSKFLDVNPVLGESTTSLLIEEIMERPIGVE